MGYGNIFKQDRSYFRLMIFENDENITLATNKFTKKLIQRCQWEIEHLSPIGFKKSNKYNDWYTLWIPNNRINYDVLDSFIEWAAACNSCVWVKLNRYTMDHFKEGVLDFCICSDWNFNFDGISGRTEIGDIEYRLKTSVVEKGVLRDRVTPVIDAFVPQITQIINDLFPESYPANIFKNITKCRTVEERINATD